MTTYADCVGPTAVTAAGNDSIGTVTIPATHPAWWIHKLWAVLGCETGAADAATPVVGTFSLAGTSDGFPSPLNLPVLLQGGISLEDTASAMTAGIAEVRMIDVNIPVKASEILTCRMNVIEVITGWQGTIGIIAHEYPNPKWSGKTYGYEIGPTAPSAATKTTLGATGLTNATGKDLRIIGMWNATGLDIGTADVNSNIDGYMTYESSDENFPKTFKLPQSLMGGVGVDGTTTSVHCGLIPVPIYPVDFLFRAKQMIEIFVTMREVPAIDTYVQAGFICEG